MTPDLERIARAYVEVRIRENPHMKDEAIIAEQVNAFWKSYSRDVVAILKAARVPSDRMEGAVDKCYGHGAHEDWGQVFSIMVDSILGD